MCRVSARMDSGLTRSALMVLLLTSQICVDGLQCYHCNSNNDSRCSWEKIPEALKADCSTVPHGRENNICRKIVQVIEFEVNGLHPEKRVIRSCGRESEEDKKNRCYVRSGFGGRQKVCSCEGDNCNSSSNLAPGILALSATFLLIRLV